MKKMSFQKAERKKANETEIISFTNDYLGSMISCSRLYAEFGIYFDVKEPCFQKEKLFFSKRKAQCKCLRYEIVKVQSVSQ